MNIDTWHHWLLLRPLFLIVMVASLLIAARLIRSHKAWRDTRRRENVRQGKSAIPSHGFAA